MNLNKFHCDNYIVQKIIFLREDIFTELMNHIHINGKMNDRAWNEYCCFIRRVGGAKFKMKDFPNNIEWRKIGKRNIKELTKFKKNRHKYLYGIARFEARVKTILNLSQFPTSKRNRVIQEDHEEDVSMNPPKRRKLNEYADDVVKSTPQKHDITILTNNGNLRRESMLTSKSQSLKQSTTPNLSTSDSQSLEKLYKSGKICEFSGIISGYVRVLIITAAKLANAVVTGRKTVEIRRYPPPVKYINRLIVIADKDGRGLGQVIIQKYTAIYKCSELLTDKAIKEHCVEDIKQLRKYISFDEVAYKWHLISPIAYKRPMLFSRNQGRVVWGRVVPNNFYQ